MEIFVLDKGVVPGLGGMLWVTEHMNKFHIPPA